MEKTKINVEKSNWYSYIAGSHTLQVQWKLLASTKHVQCWEKTQEIVFKSNELIM